MKKYLLALDQGTTSSRSIVFDRHGRPVAQAQREFPQIYPESGHVEHDPVAIWQSQLRTARAALKKAGVAATDVAGIGITNQRETTLVWDRETGEPIGNAIVWQSRITAPLCERLKRRGWESHVRQATGLLIDPYFSATKIRYLLDKHKLQRRAENGEIVAGTIDSWLIWNLTGGQAHVTDYSNASRTMLFNIHELDWDDALLEELDIPQCILPKVFDSSGEFGRSQSRLFGAEIPICGVAGDQQAATFGQACFKKGMAKNTYGTGCFILLNAGASPPPPPPGLLTTIGWGIGGKITYCLEGSVFVGGAAVQWLRDGLQLIKRSSDVESLAATVESSGGVYLVPAFVGLGAPHWDPYARGLIIGLDRGTTGGHIARAAVESMAYQSRDVIETMAKESGVKLRALRVDGGAAVNDSLMQFQADILGRPVQRPVVTETTALGAAYLAGLAAGVWSSQAELAEHWALQREFTPNFSTSDRRRLLAGWQKAVSRAKQWQAD
ncbi:MAG: glycerol kinase GlpK [Planctomycetales bacterium]|nr:glycerol kinase GlpK [Planctomycetales bacterium]